MKTMNEPAPYQVVGTLPDGREVVIERGTRREAERSYAWVRNCPVYTAVQVRDVRQPAAGGRTA